jgi:hypothetical protein
VAVAVTLEPAGGVAGADRREYLVGMRREGHSLRGATSDRPPPP